jgi:hypothetical protein
VSKDREELGRQIIAEVGHPVDEATLSLGIYGPELQPDEISAQLRCRPSSSHRRGDVRRLGSPPYDQGAWILEVDRREPTEGDDLVRQLMDQIPTDPSLWEQLRARYTLRVVFVLFVGAWNRTFTLSPTSWNQLAMFGAPVGFSIYADGDDA